MANGSGFRHYATHRFGGIWSGDGGLLDYGLDCYNPNYPYLPYHWPLTAVDPLLQRALTVQIRSRCLRDSPSLRRFGMGNSRRLLKHRNSQTKAQWRARHDRFSRFPWPVRHDRRAPKQYPLLTRSPPGADGLSRLPQLRAPSVVTVAARRRAAEPRSRFRTARAELNR
jgi:hypothetical protein